MAMGAIGHETVSAAETAGLTSREASERLAREGCNELPEKRRSVLAELLGHLWGPIPWMIEVAAILSAAVTGRISSSAWCCCWRMPRMEPSTSPLLRDRDGVSSIAIGGEPGPAGSRSVPGGAKPQADAGRREHVDSGHELWWYGTLISVPHEPDHRHAGPGADGFAGANPSRSGSRRTP